eukprot:s619_g28.t1
MPPTCNKCRVGRPSEGDSWCIGCSALEAAVLLYKKRWQHPGVRVVAEEAAVSAARFIKALHNLDSRLSPSGGSEPLSLMPKARASRPRSRSRRRDTRPPLQRSVPSREPPPRSREHRERREHKEREERRERERSAPEKRVEKEAADSYTEESGEEEEPTQDEVKREEESAQEERPENKKPEETAKESQPDKTEDHGVEGTRRQRHYREAENPLRSSHRRIDSSHLELSENMESGFRRHYWRRRCLAMPPTAESPWDIHSSEEEEGPEPREEAIRQSLREQPKPSTPTSYNVEEVDFWRHWHLPPGSVIEFVDPESTEAVPPKAALLVLERGRDPSGLWLVVKSLGAETPQEKKKVDNYFKGSKKKVHICCTRDGRCLRDNVDALHLFQFRWFPPGDYTAEWLTNPAKKAIASGKEMEFRDADRRAFAGTREKGAGEKPLSAIEKRLSALRRKEPRVSFAETTASPHTRGDPGDRRGRLDGRGGSAPRSSSQAVVPFQVKAEQVDLVGSDKSEEKRKKKKKKKSMGDVLAREEAEAPVPRATRSSGEDSSSDESLVAPLKKKSRRSPGSVFKMLEETAIERLATDGVVGGEEDLLDRNHLRPKIQTYFQIVLRPLIDARSRDCKEMAMVAKCLDLFSRWTVGNFGRRVIGQVSGHRHGHQAGVADGKALGGLLRGGGVKRATSRSPQCSEARQESRKGRRERLLGPGSALVRRQLVLRAASQRKRKGGQRKRQEGKRKRQVPEGELGCLGKRHKGETRRQAQEAGRRDLEGSPDVSRGEALGSGPGASPRDHDHITQGPDAGFEGLLKHPLEEPAGCNSRKLQDVPMRDCYTGGNLSDTEPMDKTQWLDAVTRVSGMADLGVLLVCGLKAGFLSELENRAGPSQAASQPRGSLFPLPVALPQLDGWRDAGDNPCGRLEVASNCWVVLGCVALNALYGLPGQGKQRSPGKVHVAVWVI